MNFSMNAEMQKKIAMVRLALTEKNLPYNFLKSGKNYEKYAVELNEETLDADYKKLKKFISFMLEDALWYKNEKNIAEFHNGYILQESYILTYADFHIDMRLHSSLENGKRNVYLKLFFREDEEDE